MRVIQLTYADSASGKVEATRYAFIEEEPDALAARIGGKIAQDARAPCPTTSSRMRISSSGCSST